MKRCWIHMGMHKTGTTSVQVNLASAGDTENWKILKVGGKPNMGLALYAMFATEPHKFHLFAKKGLGAEEVAAKGARYREKLRQEILSCTADNIIISGEAACIIDREGIFAMRDFIKPLCDEVRIIGYVRPPLSFRISIFQQHLKYSPCPLDFTRIKVSYRKKFEKFDDAFGRENVSLRKFEPAMFPHGCIVADFCGQIGIEPPERNAIQRVNEGLSREACGILYAFRKYGPGIPKGKDYIRENNRIVAALLAVRGTKFKVSNAILTDGMADLAKDLAWIENRLGEPLVEKPVEDGSEVTSEEDLLTIRHETCVLFATKFARIHGVEIAPERIPTGDPVDPQKVADFVDYCRRLGTSKPAKSPKSGKPTSSGSSWSWVPGFSLLKKVLKGSRKSPSKTPGKSTESPS